MVRHPAGTARKSISPTNNYIILVEPSDRGHFLVGVRCMESPIRSRGMFDDAGNALPALDVLEKCNHGAADEADAPE